MSATSEIEYRQRLFEQLPGSGAVRRTTPQHLRDLGIYGGAQGIWVNKARTASQSPDGHGITVAISHNGETYADGPGGAHLSISEAVRWKLAGHHQPRSSWRRNPPLQATDPW